PGVGRMTVPELMEFHASLLLVALIIHVALSVVFGLIYGVLLPTLPEVPRPIAWGGLLAPILWTAVSYAAMRVVNPTVPGMVSWPWFIASQLVFGITMPSVLLDITPLPPTGGGGVGVRGALAGIVGGLMGASTRAAPAM